MSSRGGGFLLVRAGHRSVGLELSQVLQVAQLTEVRPVPVVEPSVRGVIAIQGRMVPLVHLASLLEELPYPEEMGNTGVLVEVDGKQLCLEVEDAESLLRTAALPVPAGETLRWALGVARRDGELVPILDLAALSSRLLEAASR
jgi:chemotaxis signal transduction protein